jgi:hypothetical protein
MANIVNLNKYLTAAVEEHGWKDTLTTLAQVAGEASKAIIDETGDDDEHDAVCLGNIQVKLDNIVKTEAQKI